MLCIWILNEMKIKRRYGERIRATEEDMAEVIRLLREAAEKNQQIEK